MHGDFWRGWLAKGGGPSGRLSTAADANSVNRGQEQLGKVQGRQKACTPHGAVRPRWGPASAGERTRTELQWETQAQVKKRPLFQKQSVSPSTATVLGGRAKGHSLPQHIGILTGASSRAAPVFRLKVLLTRGINFPSHSVPTCCFPGPMPALTYGVKNICLPACFFDIV